MLYCTFKKLIDIKSKVCIKNKLNKMFVIILYIKLMVKTQTQEKISNLNKVSPSI